MRLIIGTLIFFLIYMVSCNAIAEKTEQTQPKLLPFTLEVFEQGYESRIDPVEFKKWYFLATRIHEDGSRHAHVFIRNPDVNSDISMVQMVVIPTSPNDGLLIGYSYYINGIHYRYGVKSAVDTIYYRISPKEV